MIAVRAGEGVRESRMRRQRREKQEISRFGDPNATGSAAAAAARRVLAAASQARASAHTRPSTRGQPSRSGKRDGSDEKASGPASGSHSAQGAPLQRTSTASIEAFVSFSSIEDGGRSSAGGMAAPDEVNASLERAKRVVASNLREIRTDFR